MRPLTLAFTGLRSYDTFGPVSFEDRSLVGILGETGAGKSTILEALCVALYGKCSWSDRDVKDLIADGAPTMTVDLTFRHDEHRWRVRRTFYRNTMPSIALLENLDTGAQVDNIRPVDKDLVRMLRMDFSAFRSAVLLPQGRFATLLHATDRDRTDLLKGIFGVDTVALIREFARTRRLALSDLLENASAARASLLPNPTAEAAAAAERAEQAEQRTTELTDTIDRLRALQAETATAISESGNVAAARRSVHTATENLQTARIQDLVVAAAAAEDQVASAEQEAATVHEQSEARLQAAEDAIATAESSGTGRKLLAAAAATLQRLAAERESVAGEHARHDQERQRLADERAGLDAEAAGEPANEQRLAEMDEIAATVQQHCDAVQDALTELTEDTRSILGTAADLALRATELDALTARGADLATELPDLERQVEDAQQALNAAQTVLDAAQNAAAAAVAGEHLHTGDACPVCTRPLPAEYTPPPGTDPAALDAARKAERTASDALNAAHTRVDNARRQHQEVVNTIGAQDRELQEARSSLASRVEQFTGLPTLATLTTPVDITGWPDDVPSLATIDSKALHRSLFTAVVHVTNSGEAQRQLIAQLLAPARQYATDLRDLADRMKRATATAKATLSSARQQRLHREQTYTREADALANAEQRLLGTCRQLADAIRNLPTAVWIPPPAPSAGDPGLIAWLASLTDADLADAHTALDAAAADLDRHERERDEAQRRLRHVAETRTHLAERRDNEITTPLRRAVSAYQTAADALRTARTIRPDLPEPEAAPAGLAAAAVREYGAAIEASLGRADAALTEAHTSLDARSGELCSRLRDQLSAAMSEVAATVPAPSADATLLEAETLDPIIDARGAADQQARAARADQQTAADQVPRAASLDDAISAGKLRRAALDELNTLLAEGKFPTDLTERRTRALLGVASELFSKLSGGEFGFAEQFQVVARRTGTARRTKTLSGGETFLASLALALALVELYSRTAGRLGALFLDEGFASLDVDTLATALEVLHTEAGGDKLVAVISHLHAVAEAVQDVLWVDKGPSGSNARWLAGEEIADLVRDDAAASLLSLTSGAASR